jgi:hypothetical protein
MSKRFLITISTILIIVFGTILAVYLAKGYTFSPKERRIVGTGIISVTSLPESASILIDGHLTAATNATIPNLPPKEYTVRVVKDGFIPWEKKVNVKEGLVTALKVTLFPAIPNIYGLTSTGVKNPVLSPDGTRLAYVVPVSTASASLNEQSTAKRKAGIWVWTLSTDSPIAFTRGREPHQIAETRFVDYSEATLRWSPDSKQVLALVDGNNFLLEEGQFNSDPRDITPSLNVTLRTWDEEIESRDTSRVVSIKDPQVRKIASESAILKWSPDETKFMYSKNQATSSAQTSNDQARVDESSAVFKVYDLENKVEFDLPPAKFHFWLPTSEHIVLVEDYQVSIVDYDGTNKATVYAGNFEKSLVFAWPDASRIVLISSFPTPTASIPNLYGINLK